MKINKTALFSLLLGSLLFSQDLAAWEQPIKIAEGAGDYYDVTSVKINSQNQIYVLYKAGNQIHLSKYDGNGVSFVKNVSDSRLLCYSPNMFITADDQLHMIWAECSDYNANTQYVKYRSFNGSWSPVVTISTLTITGTLPGGYTTRKIESMRLAVDSAKNLFIVLQANPATKCMFISRYGTQTIVESWVVTERSKLPDVAADDNYIHVVWQAKISGADGYTIKYARKANMRNGKWSSPVDVKNGQNAANSAHAPRITLDGSGRQHVLYMDDDPAGKGRNIYYRYGVSGKFSDRVNISDNGKGYYSNLAICILGSGDGFIADHIGSSIKCNWKVGGQWTGHENIRPVAAAPDNESADLSRDGKIAAVACSSDRDAVYLHVSGQAGPVDNNPPTASFTLSPASGPYPLTVTFDASASTDSDGQIVKYYWNFGDGSSGSGAVTQHIFKSKSLFQVTLTVTDNYGATGTATHSVNVLEPNRAPVASFSLSPSTGYTPLTVSFSASKSKDSDGRIVSYKWNFGDGQTGSGKAVKHQFIKKQRFEVVLTVTDDDGATDTASGFVKVANRAPTAKLSFTPVVGLYPLSVSFNAGGSSDADGKIASYHWDYGDKTSGTGVSPMHIYQKKNRYKIILTVTDDNGAMAKASGEVEVFGLYPPLAVQFVRSVNHNLFSLEYLYRVTWKANPRNQEIGANIVSYKIYRRDAGSSAAYGFLFAFPASSQNDYEYLDRSLGSMPYEFEYKVSSLDNAGRESDLNGQGTRIAVPE